MCRTLNPDNRVRIPAPLLMNTVEAKRLLEESMNEISSSSRTIWEKKDINKILDNLIDLWAYFDEEEKSIN